MTQKASATKLREFRTFLLVQQFAQKEIGARIAQARKEQGAGMTQEQLAELLNVSSRSVQDYEAGLTIPWKHFQRLEEIFKTPMSWFLHGEEPASKENELAALREELGVVRAMLEEILELERERGQEGSPPAA